MSEYPLRCDRCLCVIAADPELAHKIYGFASTHPIRCVMCGGQYQLDPLYTRQAARWRHLVRAFADRYLGGGL